MYPRKNVNVSSSPNTRYPRSSGAIWARETSECPSYSRYERERSPADMVYCFDSRNANDTTYIRCSRLCSKIMAKA